MDARCPKCEKKAVLDDEMKRVICPHCNFEAVIMKDNAVNMAADYIPDRPGF